MSGTRLPLWGALAGVVVGSLLAAGLVASGVLRVPTSRDTSDAHGELLEAWGRWRSGTFAVESEFRRTIDGRTLYSPTELVQKPPDRIVRQFGGVNGQVDGHPVVCATDQSDAYSCTAGTGQAAPYDEEVRAEVDTFRALFTPPQEGARPLYRAIRGIEPGCFELIRQLPIDDAPYGTYGKLCFDQTTGAMTEMERHLDRGVVEHQRATSIRTDVIRADFDTSSGDGYRHSMDLPAPDLPEPSTPEPAADGPSPTTTTTTATAPDGEGEELAGLAFADLLERSRQVSDDALTPYATEAVQRLLNGRASINDPHWWGDDGEPIPMAYPVVRVLLGRGAVPFG